MKKLDYKELNIDSEYPFDNYGHDGTSVNAYFASRALVRRVNQLIDEVEALKKNGMEMRRAINKRVVNEPKAITVDSNGIGTINDKTTVPRWTLEANHERDGSMNTTKIEELARQLQEAEIGLDEFIRTFLRELKNELPAYNNKPSRAYFQPNWNPSKAHKNGYRLATRDFTNIIDNKIKKGRGNG